MGHALAQGQRNQGQLNSQAVPAILVFFQKIALSGSTLAQVNLISPILTCMTSFAQLASSDALRFPKIQDQAVLQSLMTDTAVILIFIYAISRGRGVGFFEKIAFVTD